ncbi:peptidylprolyl isomerase [Maribellus comscasis]|uniref:peptidylprolyl isomerase n=1 Tax=Maribellus comscasis TaxID=2681766 RepID=A0A6I6JZA5_9BACT|nr:peptidylprolyl isomerase [Maribellus comscasis]QGY44493.1 peptidylprolyl isomerase [Maribellus comscasis]
MKNLVTFLFILLILLSCNSQKKKTADKPEPQKQTQTENNEDAVWKKVLSSVVNIDTYDENRILESGQGFFIAEDLIATKYSLVNQANKVWVTPFDEDKKYLADKYVAVDRINDIIILKIDSLKRNPIELFGGNAPNSAKTLYISSNSGKTLQLFTGKVLNLTTLQGSYVYRITNRIRKSIFGTPIFVSNHKAIGIAFAAVDNFEMQSFVIPSTYIADLLKNKNLPATLESLRSHSNKEIAVENMKIKGLVLETDMGDITIRLINETPVYRDNFIKLTKEHFFDSLLIHRVIADFGIQSGAADSRYAKKGNSVGYKGPGYTLPANIVPGLYHKRGVIGSPRKPDTQNQRRRSEGSQFYIVSGRKYIDEELDELEKQNEIKFTAEQRRIYKTIGGAPHLDGSYTIFGEVTSGMEVVDKIVKVKTDTKWRPVEDIRLKNIRILK